MSIVYFFCGCVFLILMDKLGEGVYSQAQVLDMQIAQVNQGVIAYESHLNHLNQLNIDLMVEQFQHDLANQMHNDMHNQMMEMQGDLLNQMMEMYDQMIDHTFNDPTIQPFEDIVWDESFYGIDHGMGIANPEHIFSGMDDMNNSMQDMNHMNDQSHMHQHNNF